MFDPAHDPARDPAPEAADDPARCSRCGALQDVERIEPAPLGEGLPCLDPAELLDATSRLVAAAARSTSLIGDVE